MERYAFVYIQPSYGYVCFMPRPLIEILSRYFFPFLRYWNLRTCSGSNLKTLTMLGLNKNHFTHVKAKVCKFSYFLFCCLSKFKSLRKIQLKCWLGWYAQLKKKKQIKYNWEKKLKLIKFNTVLISIHESKQFADPLINFESFFINWIFEYAT